MDKENLQKTTFNIAALVAAAKEGDENAFYEIFLHLNERLFRFVLIRTSHREDSLDLVQDVFIDLWNALQKFKYRSDQEFYGFVFLIARRKLSKYYQGKKSDVELDERYIKENYDTPYEDYRWMASLIQELKPKYQEVIHMRYQSQLSFREIAVALEIKEGTARVWHSRAIQKLKLLSKQYEPQ